MNRKQIIDALKSKGIHFDGQASTPVLNQLLRASWLTIRNATDPEFAAGEGYDFEMTINGQIGTDWYGDNGYSAKQFQDEIKPFANKRGLLNIHSGGGNIWDGFAIAEMLRNHGNVDTKILGLAASAADVIFQAGKERVMPSMAMRMAHNASSYFYAEGNATQLAAAKADLDKTISRLEKHNNTLAKMYSDRSGQSVEDVKADMDGEEFMDGDESLEKGYCDRLTNETPVTDALDLSRFKKAPSTVLNQFSKNALPPQGERPTNNQTKDNTVNKKQKIALLNSWGVNIPQGKTEETITDAWLDDEIAKGKPIVKIGRDQNIALLNSWNVQFDANATDEQLTALVAKGKPAVAAPANAAPVAVLDKETQARLDRFEKSTRAARTAAIRSSLERFAGEGRIALNSIATTENNGTKKKGWLDLALEAEGETPEDNNVLAQIAAIEPRMPGHAPIGNIETGDGVDSKDLIKGVNQALAPRNAMMRNVALVADAVFRKDLAQGSKTIANFMKRQLARVTNGIPDTEIGQFNKARAEAIANWMNSLPAISNDAQQGPYGSVTVSSDLQRQVILSEAMRAFKRRLYPLMAFAHNFGSVPLQGKDEIDVPYYPLYTAQSSRFTASQGYKFNGTDQEFRKQILVGGAGPDNKVAGQDRAYQALTFSAYLLRRQPWVDVMRLAVMRAEQLAVDILNDIFTAWVVKANFGNAVWAGAPAAFDDTVVAFLRGVAEKADWPEAMRNLVIGTDYYTTLSASPYVKSFLNIGDTNTIREGKIGGLYGFEETISSPRIPVTADGNLIGFIAYPSAVLVATSPILPAPGEMKLMVSYDLATDEDTGLSFEYKYWGEPWNSADREIIECNYGSGLGELAALKRLVAAGQ